MAHGKNRIPHRIDRRLTGPAGPEYHAIISFGLPFESEDCQYGKSQFKSCMPPNVEPRTLMKNDTSIARFVWEYASYGNLFLDWT